MAKTFVRKAGPFTVEREGSDWFVDGVKRQFVNHWLTKPQMIAGRAITATLDTGTKDAAGKPNLIGLTSEELQIGFVYPVERVSERERLAREYDRNSNEGGSGYNPYRDGGYTTPGAR